MFGTLAAGGGGLAALRCLREAQQSKHMTLLHAVAEAADGTDPAASAAVAFRAGYELLTRIQGRGSGY
jgi:HEXXH motif-containing protein